MIFETDRLIIRNLNITDSEGFFDLHSNEKVMKMIPAKNLNFIESEKELKQRISNYFNPNSKINVWAIEEKNTLSFVGLCAIINETGIGTEIGYRIREKYWRKGIGTEITKGLINFVFNSSNGKLIFADVSKSNIVSQKILKKFMDPVKETFNEEDNCIDIQYQIAKEHWLSSYEKFTGTR